MKYLLWAFAVVLLATGLWPIVLGLGFLAFGVYFVYAVCVMALHDEEKELQERFNREDD